MKHQNFTAERIAAFKCEPGRQQCIYWDGKTPGLGLRVTATGAKSYVFESRLHGCTVRLTIGDVRTSALSKVQDEATRLKTLTDQGIDPRDVADAERQRAEAERIEAQRQTVTVGNAWTAYLAHPAHQWSDRHRRDHLHLSQAGGQPKKRGGGECVTGPLHSLVRILTDRGTEYCGKVEQHEFQLYLAVNDIDHTRTKAQSPQTNGICERFHKTILNEFYQVAFRKKIYTTLDDMQTDLDAWIDAYNYERTHQGKMCCGRTPMATFEDGKRISQEKNLNLS